jgi:hypothetical protein
MDTFSHAFWGLGLFGQRSQPWWALFFGALPDLVSFAPLLLYQVATGTYVPGKPALDTIPEWTFHAYDFSHSLVIAGAAIALALVLRKKIWFAMLAWLFHILLDIPFHSADFFPTKMFWPLSDFIVDGVSWGNMWIWYPNIAGLIILFYYRWKNRHV